jgi:hypothetical protein
VNGEWRLRVKMERQVPLWSTEHQCASPWSASRLLLVPTTPTFNDEQMCT